jgi:hypothetical protein
MMKLTIGRDLFIFTFVSDTTLCHPSEYSEGETLALHQFLKEVLVAVRPGLYEGCVVDPRAAPGTAGVCPNILKSMDNVVDTEGEDGPLIHMSNVELKFPR